MATAHVGVDFTALLPDPTPRVLRRLLRHLRERLVATPMERVAQEVGPAVFTEVGPLMCEYTCGADLVLRKDAEVSKHMDAKASRGFTTMAWRPSSIG